MTVWLKYNEEITVAFEDTDREVKISYLEHDGEPSIKASLADETKSPGFNYVERV